MRLFMPELYNFASAVLCGLATKPSRGKCMRDIDGGRLLQLDGLDHDLLGRHSDERSDSRAGTLSVEQCSDVSGSLTRLYQCHLVLY